MRTEPGFRETARTSLTGFLPESPVRWREAISSIWGWHRLRYDKYTDKEETELIHKILSTDKEEFEEFLTTDWEFPHEQEGIFITAYDFTGDGKDGYYIFKNFTREEDGFY